MPRSPLQPPPATDHYHDTIGVDETAPTTDLSGYQARSEKDQVSGYAGLDSGGKILASQLPGAAATDVETAAAVAALSAVYQPLDSDLTSIAALTTTAFGRAFLALADAAALRTAAGLVIGTDVQAYDADLAAFAALAIAADKLPYGTGSHTLGLTDLSAFIRTLLDDADAATARVTLGLGTAATHATGDFATAGSMGVIGVGQLCDPSTNIVVTTLNSSSMQDLDAVNCAATFTAPASGQVLVTCTVMGAQGGSNGTSYLGFREGGTTLGQGIMGQTSWTDLRSVSYQKLVTGLTPGSVHTYKLAGAQTAGTFQIYHGPTYGAAVISVQAA